MRLYSSRVQVLRIFILGFWFLYPRSSFLVCRIRLWSSFRVRISLRIIYKESVYPLINAFNTWQEASRYLTVLHAVVLSQALSGASWKTLSNSSLHLQTPPLGKFFTTNALVHKLGGSPENLQVLKCSMSEACEINTCASQI